MARQRSKKYTLSSVGAPSVTSQMWDQWKREAAGLEYGLPAMRILNSIGKVTRLQYLESMLEMEEKYPGRGWKEAVHDLHKFYFDNNLPLNDFRARGPLADTVDKVLGDLFK